MSGHLTNAKGRPLAGLINSFTSISSRPPNTLISPSSDLISYSVMSYGKFPTNNSKQLIEGLDIESPIRTFKSRVAKRKKIYEACWHEIGFHIVAQLNFRNTYTDGCRSFTTLLSSKVSTITCLIDRVTYFYVILGTSL